MGSLISGHANKIKKYVGFSSTVTDSFTPACSSTRDVDFFQQYKGDIITNGLDETAYRYDGFSSSVTDSFGTPGTNAMGITSDGTNAMTSDTVANKIYKHSGFNSSVTDSFTPAGTSTSALKWDGTNLHAVTRSAKKVYKYTGFTSTVLDSYGSSGGMHAEGYGWDKSNSLAAFMDAGPMIFKRVGFSNSTSASFGTSDVYGVAWEDTTRYYFRNTNASVGPSAKASTDTDDFSSVPSDKNTAKEMTETKGSSETSQVGAYTTSVESKTLYRIWVGPPLAAQTLIGGQTIELSMGTHQSADFMNLHMRWFVYVWRSGSGNVKTVVVPTSNATECDNVKEGDVVSATGESGDFSVVSNDRLVVEGWWDIQNTKGNSYTATGYYDGTTQPEQGVAITSSAGNVFIPQTLVEGTGASTETKPFDIDAKLVGIRGFTVDASLTGLAYKEFTASARLTGTIDKEFLIDSVITLTSDKDIVIDGIIEKTSDKEVIVDAIIEKIGKNEFDIDSQIVNRNDKTFDVDGIVKEIGKNEFTIDASLIGVNTKEASIDAFLQDTYIKEFTIDGITKTVYDKEVVIDSILKKIGTNESVVDGILEKTDEKTFTINSWVVNRDDKTTIVDGILLKTSDKDFSVNCIVKKIGMKESIIDAALVYGTKTKEFIVDSLIKGVDTKEVVIDGILQETYDKEFTVDGIVEGIVGNPFIVDVILQGTYDKETIIDTVLVNRLSKEFSTDGVLTGISEKTFDVDSIVKDINSKLCTIDARIYKTLGFAYRMNLESNIDDTIELKSILELEEIM